MKQNKQILPAKKTKRLSSLCSVSALLLSVMCCVALVHVELRIQEHHQLLSHSAVFRDKMEEEIVRKVQKNFKQWTAKTDENLSAGQGKLLILPGEGGYSFMLGLVYRNVPHHRG